MQKFRAVLLSAVLMLLVLSGCSSQQPAQTTALVETNMPTEDNFFDDIGYISRSPQKNDTVPTETPAAAEAPEDSGTVPGKFGPQMARSRNYSFPFDVYDAMPEEESGQALGYTYPFVFDSPLRRCTGFTLEYEIMEVVCGNLTGNFRYEILVRSLEGKWKSVGTFQMDGYQAVAEVTMEEPISIDAVAVTCGKQDDSVAYSFTLAVKNPA